MPLMLISCTRCQFDQIVYHIQLDMGTAYAQIAVGTPDVYAAADSIRAAG